MLKQRHKAIMLWAKAKDYQTSQAVRRFTLENSLAHSLDDILQARIRTADSLEATKRQNQQPTNNKGTPNVYR